ncbi:MAG: glycosyltransferase family 2 protein [Anaerolineae bacterium]|jgi:glycosyltransferase involved in cell wall biosynthesis|nr:glycosyltransferase family 2 protein [Anaerolineae bacterium]
MAATPAVSVVIPLYNEEESIPDLYAELSAALEALQQPYEVIIVDDGSRDASFERLKAIHTRDPRWQIIRFRRNFGQTAGIMAGFAAAAGAVVVTIDADLQNDPRDIAGLLAKMQEGYDVVSGWRVQRQEPFFTRRLPSISANWLISRTTGVRLHDYGCTLKAYQREVAKNVRLYGDLHRFIPALASQMGVQVAEIPVNDRPRKYGRSKYGISRTFKVFLDLIGVIFVLSYFNRPLRVFGGAGLFTGGLGGLILLYLSYERLIAGRNIGERPLLLLGVLLVVLGVQMISTGLIADMLMRTYYEAQGRPTYFVREHLRRPD